MKQEFFLIIFQCQANYHFYGISGELNPNWMVHYIIGNYYLLIVIVVIKIKIITYIF